MNKLMPYFLVLAFGVIVTTRLGYVAIEYYGDNFVAMAKEEEDTPPKTKTPTLEEAETVSDKLLKHNPNDSKKNTFSEKTARHAEIKNPKDVCITGGMLKDALEKLSYLEE